MYKPFYDNAKYRTTILTQTTHISINRSLDMKIYKTDIFITYRNMLFV